MAKGAQSKLFIYLALASDLLIAAAKFVAAAVSGSSSMLSEAIHSLADAGNEVLLLYGYRRAQLPADAMHPIGYGREIYFWSFMVSMLLFAMGAGLSLYEGTIRILAPQPIESGAANYVVLAISFVFETIATAVALEQFKLHKGRFGWLEAAVKSKDPPGFMVLFTNIAAIIGILLAAAGLFASDVWREPAFDGAASIAIGLLLASVAWISARESKALLIGEAASEKLTDSIVAAALSEPSVEGVTSAITVHLAPEQVVATLGLEFYDELRTPQIEEAVVALEKRVRKEHPQVVALFIKPQTKRTFEKTRGIFYPARFANGERLPE